MSPSVRIVMISSAVLLQACTAVEYYVQAIGGHLDVVSRAVAIDERLSDPRLSVALRDKLRRVKEIRDFASRELALPDNGSYRSYAELERAFVLWNVFAAPEFSVKAVESCFPVAGCVGYRGYYREANARAYARSLQAEGYDVYVGGVPAYSTLGWFDDPVLSTFIRYPEAELARLIFHELAHQVVYVKGDTVFNESFAVAVEQAGARRWLARYGTQEQRKSYQVLQSRRREFVALVLDYRDRLSASYEQPLDLDHKRREKARLFARMREDYERLKSGWGGYSGFDRVFSQGSNNALLASVNTYTKWVPAFRALLAGANGDLPRFYARVNELARLDKQAREERLAGLTGR
ncbi:MAG: aminopeptidase [Betaproteobacteria bacterium RIFCSPLOWO2_02_FULL_63_19]|nr:MAG: aminopeptidase [Betaproteobacteria bacterium RIFCSPLOWO2_02_FULL_63_19]